MRLATLSSLVLVCSLALPAFDLVAADAPPPAPPAPTTTADPTIAMDDLALLLKPLFPAELKVEADGWQMLLKSKTGMIADVQRKLLKATGEEKDKLLAQQSMLQEEQTRIVDRLRKVLDAVKAKGGKVDDYELYISAVSGISLNVTDASATWTTVTNWLKSSEGGVRWAKNILLFILTLIAFKILGIIAGKLISRTVGAFRGTSELLREFLVNVTRKVVVFIGFVLALSMLEVNIGPFLAAMGVVGFVIGFALQGTMSNFAAGIMLLLYRPYDLGDRVTLAGQTGTVKSMTLVSSLLATDDNKLVTIPNSSVWGGVITNHGHPPAAQPTA